jgi:predicted SnoaL-like aldol condensation-catalyzing enzyme
MLSGVVAACVAATPEFNRAAARRFYEEVWFAHKVDAVDELFAPEFLNHEPRDPDAKARVEGRKLPREAQKELARQQAAGSGRIDFQVASGDRVVTRWTWTMPLTGWWERLVSGRDRIEIAAVQILRFGEDGRIAEVWNHRDDQGVEEQMRLTGLYYFEGVLFGAVLALVVSRLIRRNKPWPSSQSNTAS